MTSKEFEKYLRSIGGLENGWRACPNKYSECKYEWLSKINYFAFNTLDFLGIPERKNPFRSRIYSRHFFSIGDGWLQLVHDLIEEAISLGWNKQICQAKEKWGYLRFYTNGGTRKINDAISRYENLSGEICEVCGEAGTPNGKGWITTTCEKHRKN